MKKNRDNSEKYLWGDDCYGWHLLKNKELSIIEELMPPATQEVKHYHSKAQQFFYVLEGEATFKIENHTITVPKREGIHIEPGVIHQIRNEGNVDLEFLVISQPISRGDRVELE